MAGADVTLFDELARCRQWLEPSLEVAHGTYLWDDVVAAVYANRFQFWPLESAAFLTEFHQYPRKKTLHVFLAGGNIREILAFEAKLDDFGRANGCDSITCAGRRGWQRVVSKEGLKPATYFTERAL